MPGLLAMFSKRGWLVLLWGILLLPIGFGIQAGAVDGEALCRMFTQAIRGVPTFRRYISSDHDPLFRFHQWEANLRVLDITEIKTVPEVPWSASVHRAIDWNHSSRAFRQVIVLNSDGSGGEAWRLQTLL